jgi:hypothetical protein
MKVPSWDLKSKLNCLMVEADLDMSQFPTTQKLAILVASSAIGHEIVLMPTVNYIPTGVPL